MPFHLIVPLVVVVKFVLAKLIAHHAAGAVAAHTRGKQGSSPGEKAIKSR